MIIEILAKNKTEVLPTEEDEVNPTQISFLGKKSKRGQNTDENGNIKRCDICLELEKYSECKLIECINCGGQCHKKCLEQEMKATDILNVKDYKNLRGFECQRCIDSKVQKVDAWSINCAVCGEVRGILQKLGKTGDYVHMRCLRFFPENFDEDSDLKEVIVKTDQRIENKLRKWRTKSQCKLCKKRIEEGSESKLFVIKCANTKCKTYFHIPCAIRKNLIIPLEFMTDYYGFVQKDKYRRVIPFYCSSHNKNLVDSYQSYVNQLDQVLSETTKEENEQKDYSSSLKDNRTEEMTKDDYDPTDFNFPICDTNNISNFLYGDFIKIDSPKLMDSDQISIKSVPADEENFGDNQDNYAFGNNLSLNTYFNKIQPQKPKYQADDSFAFNLNLPNLYPVPEYNFINIENNNNFNLNIENNDSILEILSRKQNSFNTISKLFYDYLDKDIELVNTKEMSNVTISQIKDLKQFVIKVLTNYKYFDQDLLRIYHKLKENGII